MSIAKYRNSDLTLIRKTFAKDCNADEFDLFIAACKQYQLDPFKKQIYAQVFNKDKADKRQLTIVVGIDGLRSIASRMSDYRPDENEPKYTYDENEKSSTNPKGILCCTVKAYKQDNKGIWNAVSGTAYWDEFAPVKKNYKTGEFYLDGMWSKMPRLMIAKVAESQALRKGWPEASGLYSEEELHLATAQDMSASETVEKEAEEKRMKLVNCIDATMVQWEAGGSLEPVQYGKFYDRVMEKLSGVKSIAELNAFRETNNESFRAFWAKDGDAALELKAKMEKMAEDFNKED